MCNWRNTDGHSVEVHEVPPCNDNNVYAICDFRDVAALIV